MPDADTDRWREIGGCYQRNQKIFIKKNYYFIYIPLIYNTINNLDIK